MPNRLILFCVLGLLFVTTACTQVMADVTLTDPFYPNSSVTIDPGSTSGAYQWLVEGKNQMSLNSYWYRIGATGTASPLFAIGSPVVSHPADNMAVITYANSTLSIGITYLLMGSDPGSGTSDLGESVVVTNKTTSVLDLHLFEIINFDLNDTAGDDIAWHDAISTNLVQQDSVFASLLSEGGVNRLTHWEIDSASALYNKINGTSFGNLSDSVISANGDVAWGVQKIFSIGSKGSGSLSEDLQINGAPVPEPSGLLALLTGLVGLSGVLIRKRR